VRCLLVVAHPLKNSLCATIASEAADAMLAAGHELRIHDLYDSGFQPALTADERKNYYGSYEITEMKQEVEELQWAEILVLVFPTWWFGMPAVLKGWIDRVWGPGIAYDHARNLGAISPRLHALRHTVAFTTLGSPWWIDYFVLRRPVRRILKFAILGPCAPNSTLKFVSFYKCEKLSVAQVEKMKSRVRAAAAGLQRQTPAKS
jgi:NAD(P)H dehydrogenase (quinone)